MTTWYSRCICSLVEDMVAEPRQSVHEVCSAHCRPISCSGGGDEAQCDEGASERYDDGSKVPPKTSRAVEVRGLRGASSTESERANPFPNEASYSRDSASAGVRSGGLDARVLEAEMK